MRRRTRRKIELERRARREILTADTQEYNLQQDHRVQSGYAL